MKLRIRVEGHNIFLWLPTSLLKSRIVYNIIRSALKDSANKAGKQVRQKNTQEHDTSSELQQMTEQDSEAVDLQRVSEDSAQLNGTVHSPTITRKQLTALYNALKRCIKVNGHFNLVEVEGHNGEKVRISV